MSDYNGGGPNLYDGMIRNEYTVADEAYVFTAEEWRAVADRLVNAMMQTKPLALARGHAADAVYVDDFEEVPKMSVPAETDLDYVGMDWQVEFYTDGTITECLIAETADEKYHFARGIAKRRKGERRNAQVGQALALSRALQDAADRYAAKAEELLES